MNRDNLHIDEEILIRILEETASDKDKEQFREWMSTAENKAVFEKMQKIWKASNEIEVFQNIDVEADWAKVKAKSKPAGKVINLRRVMSYAASIIVIAAVGFGYLFQTTPGFGKLASLKSELQKEEIVLADGSQIYLNKNSKLIYPKQFNTESRNVVLEGEAFFQEEKNPAKPFIIESGNAIIEVLGTSFNVRNETGGKTIVTVNSGKVSLKYKNSDQVVYLTKGEKGVLEDTIVSEHMNDEPNFDSWKTGVLRFKKTPIPLMLRYIENYYGLKITNRSSRIDTMSFTSTFDNASIDKVIDELEMQLRVKTVKKRKHLIITDKK
jgi:ferric-dicitrate binding protein FerR (iron transport regulator)